MWRAILLVHPGNWALLAAVGSAGMGLSFTGPLLLQQLMENLESGASRGALWLSVPCTLLHCQRLGIHSPLWAACVGLHSNVK